MEVDDKKSRAEDKVALSEFKNIELAVNLISLCLKLSFYFLPCLASRSSFAFNDGGASAAIAFR